MFKLFGIVFSLLTVTSCVADAQNQVIMARVPHGGIQPQVVVEGEVIHLIYFQGDPKAGNIYYLHSENNGSSWSSPLQVNSQVGSAVAMGTIRGATLAVGKGGRVHVVWNGSDTAMPRNASAPASERKYGASPLLYSRLDETGQAFEAQRNVMTKTFDLDGGAYVAGDNEGHIYVAWHANDKEGQGESGRRVWIAISSDEGTTFAAEKPVWNTPTGACSCCQVALKADNGGQLSLLYRSATENVHRDTYLLQSNDYGQSFRGQKVSDWNINACPMSRFEIVGREKAHAIGWESEEQVYFSKLNSVGKPAQITPAPGAGANRKYPSLAFGPKGELLFAWTEGTSWNRGGSLRYQIFDAQNKPIGNLGKQDGVPAWSFATAFARPDGQLEVLY